MKKSSCDPICNLPEKKHINAMKITMKSDLERNQSNLLGKALNNYTSVVFFETRALYIIS